MFDLKIYLSKYKIIVGIKRQPIIFVLLTFRDMLYNPVNIEIIRMINPKNPDMNVTMTDRTARVIIERVV